MIPIKRTLALFCCTLLCICLAVPALAEEDAPAGYAITRYAVEATLHENNTVTQTEALDVRFDTPHHGIYRVLPQTVQVEKQTEDGSRKITYRANIRDISVEGAPFEKSTEDGMVVLRIGDEDTLVTGEQSYTIRFTYDIGDDRVAGYDELFYSLNGPGWQVPIEAFTYRMAFDKPLPEDALAGLSVFSGAYGAAGNDAGVTLNAQADAVYGESTRALQPGEAVTLHARLPEGYFTGERTALVWPAWAALVLAAALGLFTLVRALLTRRRRAVPAACCDVPGDMSSAEAGFLIDGSADDRDLLSLILWFAQKGYLALSPDEWDGTDPAKAPLILTKRRPLAPDAPAYQHTLFNGLFPGGGTTFRLSDPAPGFYEALQQAKTELAGEFEGEKALYEKHSTLSAILLPMLCCGLWLVGAIGAGGFITGRGVGLGLLCSLPLAVAAVLVNVASSRWQFARTGERTAWGAGLVIVCVGTAAAAWLAAADALVPAPLLLGAYCVTLAACLFAPRIAKPTAYQAAQCGLLLGLYQFICEARQPQLEPILDENPTYFYDMLPYAYVFGLAEEWAAQFEALPLAPPVWYPGCYGPFYVGMFSRSMQHGFEQSLAKSYAAHAAASDAGSSGTGGSSGGFSGGGFGGGGGGAW